MADSVAVIGAGIAGPAVGLAPRRAGLEAVVYESSTMPRDDVGAFLNLAPNGINVLQAAKRHLPIQTQLE